MQRILVYRTGRLGDFIVAVPAINLIRRAYPNAVITLVTCISTKQKFAERTWHYATKSQPPPWLQFLGPELVQEILVFQSLKDFRGLFSIALRLSGRSYHEAFILPFSSENLSRRLQKWLFLRLLGVSCPIRGMRDTVRGPEDLLPFHQVRAAMAAAAESKIVAKVHREVHFNLKIGEVSLRWAEELWSRLAWGGCRVIAVFVGGTYSHKQWPLSHFLELCLRLRLDSCIRFLFIGSAAERKMARQVTEPLGPNACNVCGETNLQQLAALLSKCDLFVGNDSGPAHLAAAVGLRCVTLMSSIHPPGFWEPWGSENRSIRKDVPCRHCLSETFCPTGTESCIRQINVEDVYDAVKSLLETPSVRQIGTHLPITKLGLIDPTQGSTI